MSGKAKKEKGQEEFLLPSPFVSFATEPLTPSLLHQFSGVLW
jgi:hypothetical protein